MEPVTERVRIVLCTCPDDLTAEQLSLGLVEARLAACVNIVPGVRSVFRWQDKVQSESEVLLLIKTISERYPDLESWLNEHHPYDVPEILMLPIDTGSAPYLNWVSNELT